MSANSTNTHQRSRKRDFAFGLFTIIFSTLVCLAAAETGLRWYQRSIDTSSRGDPGLLRYHPRQGWSLTPSWQGRHQHHDFDVTYTINGLGYRGEYPRNSSQQTGPSIAILGDSFSFGLGVNDEDVFTEQLNQQHSGTRFINLSVPGYSTDQQLLLLKTMHHVIEADEYILVFYLGNDLLDNMLEYPLQLDQAKSRFVINNNKLVLENVPVPRQTKPAALRTRTITSILFGDSLKDFQSKLPLRNSYIWKRLVPERARADRATVFNILDQRLVDHKEILKLILAEMKGYLEDQNRGFRIALLPGRSFILAPDSYSAFFQDYARLFVKEKGKRMDIPVIDIAGQMRELQSEKSDALYYPNEGHLTKEGHRLVSEILAKNSTCIKKCR